jgi:hypothetical protein
MRRIGIVTYITFNLLGYNLFFKFLDPSKNRRDVLVINSYIAIR